MAKSPDQRILDQSNPAGRPCKLTVDVQSRICAALQRGNYIETAAAHAGVVKSTLYDWLKTGARDLDAGKNTKFGRFSNAVEAAMAESEIRDLEHLSTAAGAGSWQAAAWKLERRFPKRWGRVNPDAIPEGEKGQGSGITIQVSRISDAATTD